MNSKFTRVIAVVLSVLMVVGTMSISASAAADYTERTDDYYKLIKKDDYQLAPGIVESEIVLNNAAGSHRQVAHVVEVDIHNQYTKVIPSYKGMIPTPGSYGVQIMSEQAAFAEANGYGNVVAAMNLSLSWYDSQYYLDNPHLVGEPLGYMVLDGVMYTNSKGQSTGAQTCLVINFDEKDGVARPESIPKTEIRSTASAITGWEEQVIPANFGFLVKNGVNQYAKNHTTDAASRSFVGIKADGSIVMVMNDGRQSPYSAGFNNYEMAEFMLSLGCVQAVNGDGGGSSAFLSQRPGEELKLNCSPSDGAERETTHGILVISTAPATGEFVRASISSASDYYTPNSTVEFTAIGTDLVGTAAAIPADAVWQLADSSFGTIDQNGTFVSSGKEGAVTIQMVYNNEVVGEDTINIVMPDTIAFGQSNMVVPYGKTVDVGLTATYDSKEVVIKVADVEFTLSDNGIGAMDGFNFVAAEEGTAVTAATLTAKIGNISVTTNLSLGKGSEIAYDFEDSDLTGWEVDDWYGQYGPTGPNGNVKDPDGNYWYNGQNELGSINIVTAETGKVKNGTYALAANCDFTQIYETGYHGLKFTCPTVDCTDAVAVGFWMYIPYDARHAEIRLMVGGSASTVYDNGQLFDLEEGWHYIKIDVSQVATKTFTGFNIQIDDRACSSTGSYYDYITEPNLNGKYTFYIDDITVDYSTAVDDREAPVFSAPIILTQTGESSAVLNGQTINYKTPTIEASVKEDTTLSNATGLDDASAKAYVDGVLVDCVYKNGKFTLSDVVLANGIHTVKFSIADKMGNTSWVAGTVNVQTATDDSTIKVVPQDADADRLLVGSLYWMDVVATDIETVDKVELTFDMNNASAWELAGMTTAEGFTATYSVQADDNIATIIIKRTGKNTATGEAVLASFPVRTWVSTITECEGYENQTPATMVKRGIIWAQSIEIALERGIVTFVDASSSTFGMDTVLVDTELFFTNYSRKSVEGAQAYIDACKAAGKGWHEHTETALDDVAATCTKDGYSGRTFCAECNSVVNWGTVEKATGHSYNTVDGVLKCECGDLFNGVLEGVTYIDGVIATGWVDETYYYVNGVALTGSHFMDGKMYTFDANGVYQPDYMYEGFYEINNTVMYFLNNQYLTGVNKIADKFYNFDKNGMGLDGEVELCGTTCLFDNGLSVETATVKFAGLYGDDIQYVIYKDGRMIVDGNGDTADQVSVGTIPWYDGIRGTITSVHFGKNVTSIGARMFYYAVNLKSVTFEKGSKMSSIRAYAFGRCSSLVDIQLPDGLLSVYGYAFSNCPALKNVIVPDSVISLGNDKTFVNSNNVVLNVWEGTYGETFATKYGIDYVYNVAPPAKNGLYFDDDGEIRYYVEDVPVYAGLVQDADGNYYYISGNGFKAVKNCSYYVSKTNDLLPARTYTFDANGKLTMKNGIVIDENGDIRYYVNDVPTSGLVQDTDGSYYYISGSTMKAVKDCKYYVSKTNGLLPARTYSFGPDGKLIIKNGIVIDENGDIRYYVNDVLTSGLVQDTDGSYYYISGSTMVAVKDCKYYVSKTNGLLPARTYTFGPDGKMIIKNGIVIEENGDIRYYVNDVLSSGLAQDADGNYYYISGSTMKAVKNCKYYTSKTNGLLPAATYTFGADGKLIFD